MTTGTMGPLPYHPTIYLKYLGNLARRAQDEI